MSGPELYIAAALACAILACAAGILEAIRRNRRDGRPWHGDTRPEPTRTEEINR